MKNTSGIVVPVIVTLAAALWLLVQMTAPEARANDMDLEEAGTIPCVSDGRVKPLDTMARTSLMIISNKQTFVDDNGKEQPAIRWLLDVMTSVYFHNPAAAKYKVFRIDSEQLLNILELQPRKGFRYSAEELAPKTPKIIESARRIREKDQAKLDPVDKQMLDLYGHLGLYKAIAELRTPLLVPPGKPGEDWGQLDEAFERMQATRSADPVGLQMGEVLLAYAQNKPEDFKKQLDKYHELTDKNLPGESGTARFETFFNHFAPFYWCSILYLGVILLACFSWLGWTLPLHRAAFWLAVLALVVHTWALGARMSIQGRPPVTNLYSSAVFIGWGAVGLCLFLEYIYHNGLCLVGAGALGSATLFIAHYLGASGDTLQMMEAVLDTNFWLATHVVCVTLGYTATFVAGFLGLAFVLLGVCTPFLGKDWVKALGQATYGVVCFATLLSFVGTVLGGIWNALILHARWGGMVKEAGIAVLALGGNIVTAWSWFGTNQLGVGLHAYGFNNTLATACALFWVSQALVILAGCLPLKWWWSYRAARFTPPPVARPRLNP